MSFILSLFPGVGLLDRAFEEEGYCVVRGPDHLWGGDVRRFTPPTGVFHGVIGGPPCQSHSSFAALNRAQGHDVAEDQVPEFVRCILCAQPLWWLMENVPGVPNVDIPGYQTHRVEVNARWFGCEQHRRRAWQFGTPDGRRLDLGPSLAVIEAHSWEPTVLAAEGRHGIIVKKSRGGKHTSRYRPRRHWARVCELQGLPPDFLKHAPFTIEGKYVAIGNGVPIPMGRAFAAAIRRAMSPKE